MPLPKSTKELDALKAKVEANRPKPPRLQPGTYRGKIAAVTEKKSRKTQLPMLSLETRMVDVPGRPKIHSFVMMEGGGSFKYWGLLDAIGYDPAHDDGDGDVEALVGRKVNVILTDEVNPEDQSVRSAIKKFLPYTAETDEMEDGSNGNGSKPKIHQTVAQADAEDDVNTGEPEDEAEGNPAKPESAKVAGNLLKRIQDARAKGIKADAQAQT